MIPKRKTDRKEQLKQKPKAVASQKHFAFELRGIRWRRECENFLSSIEFPLRNCTPSGKDLFKNVCIWLQKMVNAFERMVANSSQSSLTDD